MAASSSSSSGGSFKYDVFINFRGEDTRRCFVCHLYQALKLKALDTFIDSEELRKGDDLSELLKAIQGSRLSIVVFSKNYASSTWCLKELVQILECMDRQSQIVVPVFYEVDPSHIRKRKESFAKAFAKHESNSNVNKEELESWKSSLTRATNLSGHDSGNYQDDIQLIESIVEDILEKVIRISPSKTDGLIGMDTHMNKIDSLFKSGVDDCRHIVGIRGMGGIGKSTIARAVYEKYSPQFEHKCFLDNVKEGFLTKNGKVLLEDLLSKILKIKDRSTLDEGLNMMRERLGEKKILLVLDDVDKMEQIDTLIGENPSFGDGSRIIITTRDKSLLARFLVYEPELFTTEKALELFRRYAFRTIKFSESYDEISRRAVEYAHRLPLALKVLGGLLDNKKVEEWEYELEKIKKMSITFVDDNKIGRVLRASYDGLDVLQKKIFLDIACFFRGNGKKVVTLFHESCGFFPENGLRVLEERSLVTVSLSPYGGDELEMHDLIQEMGREIVRQESTKDPGRRSRLWYYEDVLQVLAQNTPAEAVEGIILDLSELKELWVNYEAFVGMKRLKLLQLTDDWFSISTCKQHVSGDLKSLSNELRILAWHGCPLKSLPSDFQLKNLIEIDMSGSRIEQLWEGTKPLPDLVHMNLSRSKDLIKTPDLAEATNLEYLNLEGCTSLLGVHPSISALESLVDLSLEGCSNLVKFPNISGNMKELTNLILDETSITEMPSSINDLPELEYLSLCECIELRSLPSSIHMKSLGHLDLSGCSKLEEFPEISEVMEKLHTLDLDGTAVKELPSSINNLTGLERLRMRNCTSLVSLPDEICNLACLKRLSLTGCIELRSLPSSIHMKSLTELYLSGCSKLEEFPEISEVMEKLIELYLDGTAIKELPSSINNLTGLEHLIMRNCTSLVSLPDEICNLACLEMFDLTGCSKLSKLPDNFQNWKSLGKRTSWRSYSLPLNNLKGSGIKQLPFCISQMESLFCIGLKELTAPFSSWPTCMRNPSSSILVYLDLSYCNVLELSDAIAHLSSLRKLDLSGNNNLESLPEAMNRLGHLKKLYLRGCKGLKSIPELCSSIQRIDANNCTSLETVSTPQLPCVGSIHFTFFNCLKLAKTNLFMDIVETAATDNEGEVLRSDRHYHMYSDIPDSDYHMCLPGSDIPDWFNHQHRGSSVTVQLPPDLFEGLAICAISGARNRETLESTFCCVTCKENEGQDNFYFRLQPKDICVTDDVPLESDHMILGYINLSNFENRLSLLKCTEATFRIIETWDFESIPVGSRKWKDCGVRLFQMNAPSSVDLVCNVENRETEISSKRKRETLERGKEKMGVEVQEEEEECSGGPLCSCFSLSGCTMSLRKKQRQPEREAEGVAGLESEEADVSGEGGLLTLSL